MEDVIVYSIGIMSVSICANNNLTIDEITDELNNRNPTGLDHGWEFAKDENFNEGKSNPCKCNHYPKTRKHYLFHC
ncbi:MAG: hypothetical protein LLG05_05800 [Porphyromonadaceae bacterium]|nr:hypothetical protein [Porphyromonadaceae bacterium]